MNREISDLPLIVCNLQTDAARIEESGNFIDGELQLTDSQVIFHGRNNYIVANGRVGLVASRLEFFSDNSLIFLDEPCVEYRLDVRLGFGCTVFFGQGANIDGILSITCAEEANVIVGPRCAFGSGVRLCADDGMPVWDELTGLRANSSAGIYVGSHVWLADEAHIMRGVSIGSGSMAAPKSVVYKSVGSNVSLAGNPAQIISKNVCWSRHNLRKTPAFNQPETLRPRSIDQAPGSLCELQGEDVISFSSRGNALNNLHRICESVLTAGFEPAPKAEFIRNVLVPYRD